MNNHVLLAKISILNLSIIVLYSLQTSHRKKMRDILSGKYCVTSAAPFAFWALLIKFWYNIISSAGKKCNTKRKEKYMFGIVPSIFQPISFVTKGEKTLLVYDYMLHIRSKLTYHFMFQLKEIFKIFCPLFLCDTGISHTR